MEPRHLIGLPRPPARPAIAELYREHASAVTRWAARLSGPRLEVDDVVQEVFLIAQRQLASFRGDASPSTWLFGITRNVVRHRLRRERLRGLLTGSLRAERTTEPLGPTPIEELERRQSLALVYAALDALPERYRTPFILYELEGLTAPEIAGLTGLHPTTLRVRLHRARARFVERLAALDPQERHHER